MKTEKKCEEHDNTVKEPAEVSTEPALMRDFGEESTNMLDGSKHPYSFFFFTLMDVETEKADYEEEGKHHEEKKVRSKKT